MLWLCFSAQYSLFFLNVHHYCFCLYLSRQYWSIRSNSNNAYLLQWPKSWFQSDSGPLWPVTVYICFLFFFKFETPSLAWAARCAALQRAAETPPSNQDPWKRTVVRLEWRSRVFFLRPDLCLGSVLRQWVDSTSSCSMYNSTRVSVKVVQVIVVLDVKWRRLDWFLMTWKILVTKNQSRCLNFQNSSTHVQHTCMHKYLPSFLVGMITYWVMQTRLQH